MHVLEYSVLPEFDGISVQRYVRGVLGFSARMLTKQKHLENGLLKNGWPCRSVDILRTGDRLSLTLPEEQGVYPAVSIPITVLFETEDHLAVDKPAGMPVHPSPGHDLDSLLNAAAFYFQETGQNCLFRPLYRLDKDTSGVVLLGKHRAAVSSAQVEKRYFAVCEGKLSGSGTVELPIGLKEGSKIVRECGHGEAAVTLWRAIASSDDHTLLSIKLETGRTHQIRTHLSHEGYPLAGDDLYGGSRKLIGRQALHCGWVHLSGSAFSVDTQLISEFPPDIRAAFPWLPEVRECIKEEALCQPV